MTPFAPLTREPSLAARVTEEILASIADGTFAAGSWLPSERQLGEQFGVSRTVIREAVRVLEAKGVLEVRSGRGARVIDVGSQRVSETMALYLSSAQSREEITPDDIMEVRTTLELRLIALASERIGDADIEALRANVRAMRAATDAVHRSQLDEEFHSLVAGATHNVLFVTLLEAINAAMLPNRITSLDVPGRVEVAASQHEAVVEALAARDREAALAAMDGHLQDSAQFYLPAGETADE